MSRKVVLRLCWAFYKKINKFWHLVMLKSRSIFFLNQGPLFSLNNSFLQALHAFWHFLWLQTECFFLKICLVPGNFHANLSPKLKQDIRVNHRSYQIILYPTLNLMNTRNYDWCSVQTYQNILSSQSCQNCLENRLFGQKLSLKSIKSQTCLVPPAPAYSLYEC